MRRLALVLLTAAAVAAAGSAQASRLQSVPPGAIAVVAGEAIPRAAFDREMQRRKRGYELKKRAFPRAGSPAHRKLRDAVVALLVWRTEVRQKAKADFGIEVTPGQIEQRLGEIRQQWGSNERLFQRMLRRLGLTLEALRADIRAKLTYEAVERVFLERATVTDEEVAAFYAERRPEYTDPENRDVRHIQRGTRAAAARIAARLRRGAQFAALARRYSLDRATRRRGGVVNVQRGRGDARFERAAFALRRGQISAPVRTRAGWHVIQALSAVRPARTKPLAEVRGEIKELLTRSKALIELRDWLAEMRAEFAGKVVYAPGFEPGR